jgi:hypothetical protein
MAEMGHPGVVFGVRRGGVPKMKVNKEQLKANASWYTLANLDSTSWLLRWR